MHIDAQRMSDTVREKRLESPFFEELSEVSFEDSKIPQAIRELSSCGHVDLRHSDARTHLFDSDHLSSQHDIMEISELRGEHAANRYHAGDIARIHTEFCSGIDENELSFLELFSQGAVMEGGRGSSARHDRAECRFCPVHFVKVFDECCDLSLLNTILNKGEYVL